MNKTTSLLILVFIFHFSLSSQNIVLPKGKQNFVYDEMTLTPLGEIKFPITSKIKINRLQHAYCLDTTNNFILHSFVGNSDNTYFVDTIEIPQVIKPHTIAVSNDFLFLGGSGKTELACYMDIKTNEWKFLDIPQELKREGKAIDDFYLDGSSIVALDNIVMPKYMLHYTYNSKDSINFNHKYTIPPSGPYENYKRIVGNKNYYVLLSGSFSGWSGLDCHLTILDKKNPPDYPAYEHNQIENLFENVPLLSYDYYSGIGISKRYKRKWFRKKHPLKKQLKDKWIDISILGDNIYVLSQGNKLFSITIRQKYFKKIYDRRERYTHVLKEYSTALMNKRKLGKINNKWFIEGSRDSIFVIYESKNSEYGFIKI